MTVQHAFDDLFEKSPAGLFIEFSSFDDIVQQFPTLEEFHYDGDLHVFEGEAVVHFDDVLVTQGFQNLGLNENGIDVAYRPDVLCFNGFDGKFLLCKFVDCKVDFSESAFTQDGLEFILTKAAAGVEVFTLGGVEDGFVLDVGKIIIEVLCTV